MFGWLKQKPSPQIYPGIIVYLPFIVKYARLGYGADGQLPIWGNVPGYKGYGEVHFTDTVPQVGIGKVVWTKARVIYISSTFFDVELVDKPVNFGSTLTESRDHQYRIPYDQVYKLKMDEDMQKGKED